MERKGTGEDGRRGNPWLNWRLSDGNGGGDRRKVHNRKRQTRREEV